MSADDNHESSSNALVPRPGTGLAETGRRTHPVLARMSRDLLVRAEAQGLSTARYRLGKYVFREPDYRQILDWAEVLDERPEWVLEQLEDSRLEPEQWGDYFEPIGFVVEDSAIRSLVWDFERLPIVPEPWRVGLLIQTLGLIGEWPKPDSAWRPDLSHLKRLYCSELGLSRIDLSAVPGLTALTCSKHPFILELTKLSCWGNELSDLDLTPVPELISLDCSGNPLTELRLTPVPELISLNCWSNQLTALNLTPVPRLTTLYCGSNSLAELDLTPVPALISLYCWNNQLTELDLMPVPRLTTLYCGSNPLAELDLTPVPELTSLNCWDNLLNELDLTPVPGLTILNCSYSQLTELDLTPVPNLTKLWCDKSVRLINPPAALEVHRL